jgi:hypothetical protein
MTHTDTSSHTTSDGEARIVGEVISRAEGRQVHVAFLTRQASEFATLFPAEVLTVTLDDGRELRLFRKHLGDEQANQPDKQRRDREIRVYEDLLALDGANQPVARYFGSRRNLDSNRLELYLEFIDDWPLRYHDLEHWFAAARRLAGLHAHFAMRPDALRASEFLLRLDAAYFGAWGERACVAVAGQSPELGGRIETLLQHYGSVCRLLASQPPTLVHNDLACKNIIADRSATPTRICIIDWELAGAGCGLLDVVHLKYGLDAVNDAAMVDAYRSQLASTELLPHDDRAFAQLLAACELHKTLYRLANSPAWKLPLDQLARWVADAERFLAQIGAS